MASDAARDAASPEAMQAMLGRSAFIRFLDLEVVSLSTRLARSS